MTNAFTRAAASMAAMSMATAAVAAWSSSASAQTAGGSIANAGGAGVDNFSRSRNTSVKERLRPGYDSVGIRAGAFLIYPRIETSIDSNDNIFASETGETSDTILNVRPEIAVESNWSRNFLSVYARGAFSRYQDNETEDTEQYGIGTTGRLDISRPSSLGFGADFIKSFEPRTAPTAPRNAVEPTEVDISQAYLSGSHVANRVKLTGRLDWRSLDYADGRTGLGAIIDQDARDRDVVSVSGRIDVAISPETAFFFQATGNERRYDVASTPLVPNRDSTGSEFLFGANFELGALVRGEVAAGYIEQNFEEAVFADADGYGARAQLEWFPSALTTVTVSAGRTIEDTPVIGAAGYVADGASIGIDHDLRYNILLNARVSWGRDAYNGIDREDTRLGASIGATYLINRNFGLSATVSTTDSSSEGLARDQDFRVNRLAVSLVTQF